MTQADLQQAKGPVTAASVLRRKAGAGRPRPADPVQGTERGVRLALARAAQEVPGLTLSVGALMDDRRSLAELMELIPAQSLLAMIEGPAEGLGLVALSPPVLSGIVEVQTMGRLAPDARPARKPTRTDAAMSAGLVDRILTGLEAEFAEAQDLTWAGGFRYASFLDDPRPLGLLLDDIPYRVFSASVTLCGGTRDGEVLLVLPAEGRGPAPGLPEPEETPAQDIANRSEWSRALGEAVMGAEAGLTAVLHRLRLPLSSVMGLASGALIPVPAEALDRIELEALDGRRLGGGKLGQNRGMRAVRLTRMPGAAMPDPDVAPATEFAAAPPVAAQAPAAGFPAADPSPLPLQAAGEDDDALVPMAMPMVTPLDAPDFAGGEDPLADLPSMAPMAPLAASG